MNVSSSSAAAGLRASIEPYQTFARNQAHQNKVIVAVNGSQLSFIKRDQIPSDKDSLILRGKDGLEYTIDEPEQVVAHFKKALEKRYGEKFANHIFSPEQEAEAINEGLSHAIVEQVFRNANTEKEYNIIHGWKDPIGVSSSSSSFLSIKDVAQEKKLNSSSEGSKNPKSQVSPEHDYRFMKLDLQDLQQTYKQAKYKYERGTGWLIGGEVHQKMIDAEAAINKKKKEIAAFEEAHPELTWRNVSDEEASQRVINSSFSSASASSEQDDTLV